MGMIRKMFSVASMGAVDMHSKKEIMKKQLRAQKKSNRIARKS